MNVELPPPRPDTWEPIRIIQLTSNRDVLLSGVLSEIFEELDSPKMKVRAIDRGFVKKLQTAKDWLLENVPRIIYGTLLQHFKTHYDPPHPNLEDILYNDKKRDDQPARPEPVGWRNFLTEPDTFTREETLVAMKEIFQQFKAVAPQLPRVLETKRKVTLGISGEKVHLRELVRRVYRGLFTILMRVVPDITDQELTEVLERRTRVSLLRKYLEGIDQKGESLTTTGVAQAVRVPRQALQELMAADAEGAMV